MSFEQYLEEIRQMALLTPEEESRLWQQYKEEDEKEARSSLIEHYQPLVFKVAMRFRGQPQLLMDSIQEGTVGLIEAVESYQPERGVAFSLYAVHRIRGRILNFLEKEGKVSLLAPEGFLEQEAGKVADTAAPVAEQVEQRMIFEHLRSAMQRLPATEKAVLMGVYLQEQQPRELADTLDLSLSHIYRLQKKGVRRIRGMVSRFMHDLK